MSTFSLGSRVSGTALDWFVRLERSLASIDPDDAYALCRAIHTAAEQVMPVDAFYVCRWKPESGLLVFIYNFDNMAQSELDQACVMRLGNGPASHVVRTGKSYVYDPKHPEIQHGGINFGNTDIDSQSALHVPIIAPSRPGAVAGDVLGALSAQSYRPDAYSREALLFLEWLAEKAGQVLGRGLDRARQDVALCAAEAVAEQRLEQLLGLVEVYLGLHSELECAVDAVAAAGRKSRAELQCALSELKTVSHRMQAKATWLPFLAAERDARRSANARPDPLAALTEREREILPYLASGQSHAEIANLVHISPRTIKFHQENILRKLDLPNRAHLAGALSRHLQVLHRGPAATDR